jgi:2-amino-4-hydroxy-6-hydroxymethyldihydropteridine diphosphokinase
MKAVIALGANLGNPQEQIQDAIDLLSENFFVVSVSQLRETEPVDAPGQPHYLNGIAIIESEIPPLDLLRKLLEIELAGGRKRSVKNAARTIDLDLIAYGEIFVDSPELTLPHPRPHQRKFVLEPWFEIEPNAVLPGYGPVRELLRTLE